MKTFNRWILADCVESFKKDSTQSANIHLLKIFILRHNFAESASAKIDVNKFFKLYLLDGGLWSSKCLFKTFCLVGLSVYSTFLLKHQETAFKNGYSVFF